jgi:nucleotide-binding universal stress UspA family protein
MTAQSQRIKTILIATSLTAGSDELVATGLALARAAGAKAYVVHAVPAAPALSGDGEQPGPEAADLKIAWRKLELELQLQRLGLDPGAVGWEVQPGAPHRVVVEAARRLSADLVVLGATDDGGRLAKLLGSTADRVVRKAPCPVLVVRGKLRVPPARILAPVDLSLLAGDALHCGLRLLAGLGAGAPAEAEVLYSLTFFDALHVAHGQQPAHLAPDEAARKVDHALRRFVADNAIEQPVHLTTTVRTGDPRVEILRALEEHPADLVLMGTHGHGGLDRLMLGSVASAVVREAPCSVLLIPAEVGLGEALADAVREQTAPRFELEPVP